MNYFLAPHAVLKWLEVPAVYQMKKDELYELDGKSFSFLKSCMSASGCTTQDSAFIDYCLDEQIITTEYTPVKRPALVRASDPSLRYLELQITNACNLRCKHCYIGDEKPAELPLNLIHGVLCEFQDGQGLRVLITGGEPLLHSEFDAINELLPDLGIRKVLFTNGMALNKKTLSALNVDEIQISIDGLETAHDAMRGNGTFTCALDAVREAREAGFDVSISTMVHAGNLQDFGNMEVLFKTMGIKEWSVDVPCATGRLKDNPEFQLKPERGGKYLGYGYGAGLHGTDPGFGCGLHLMSVLADGRAAKCTFYGDRSVGTITEGLDACWKRIKPIRLRNLDCDCEYRDLCRGGCRYRAELLDGEFGRDLYRCALYDILKPGR